MSLPKVVTVILNTNRREDTLACLASLSQNSYANNHILVLDNTSSDGSVDAIRKGFPEVQMIGLTQNKGYAGNNNVGIQAALEAGADWVFILNEDTIMDADCLSMLVNEGESDPQIGIVGPMVYHHNEPEVIQSAGGIFGSFWEAQHVAQNEPDEHQFTQPRRVEWISGCAILVRRPVIEQLGMLDERFFYYWEEVEWCLRASRKGWKIMHVPQAKLWHKGVQRNYQPKPTVTYYSTRNKLLMLKKHHAPLNVKIGTWLQNLRTLASWSIRPKWRSMHAHRDAMWHGMRDYLRQRWGPTQN